MNRFHSRWTCFRSTEDRLAGSAGCGSRSVSLLGGWRVCAAVNILWRAGGSAAKVQRNIRFLGGISGWGWNITVCVCHDLLDLLVRQRHRRCVSHPFCSSTRDQGTWGLLLTRGKWKKSFDIFCRCGMERGFEKEKICRCLLFVFTSCDEAGCLQTGSMFGGQGSKKVALRDKKE